MRKRVLLIEDDTIDQMAFKRTVIESNLLYDYGIAGSIAEAKKVLQDEDFDVIITDYNLGDGTALDIFDAVKNAQIIITTGAGNEEIAVKAMKAGAYEYLIKDQDRNYLKILPVTVEKAYEHKIAGEALKEIEEKYSDLFENANDLIQSFTPEGKFIYVNRAWLETLEYEKKDIQYLTIRDIIHPESQEHCLEVFERLFAGEKIDKIEAAFVTKSGRKIMLEGSVNCKMKNGRAVSIRSILRDVTERKKAEEYLHATISRLKALVNNLQIGIIFENEFRDILFVNEVFCSMFDIPSPEEIMGLNSEDTIDRIKKLFENSEDFQQRIDAVREKQHNVKNDILRLKDGKIFERDYIPIYSDKTFFGNLWQYRDITERMKIEEKRKQLEEELTLSEKSAALGRVAAGIAHEINNPASAIQSDLSIIMEYIKRLPRNALVEKITGIASRDLEAVTRITNIVQAMKGSYRPEGWHFTDINKEIDGQLTLLHKQYKYRIKITKQYASLPRVKVYGSEIGQVFLNLLANAIDAIQDKGEITITTEEIDADSIEIKIKDTGQGIPKKDLPHIFDPFYTSKAVGKGTGLGLSTSSRIAKKHNGRLYLARTKKDAGSTFVLVLPKDQAA